AEGEGEGAEGEGEGAEGEGEGAEGEGEGAEGEGEGAEGEGEGQPGCTDDADCRSWEICEEDGTCQPRPCLPPRGDCGPHATCTLGGVCAPDGSCEVDADCPAPLVCDPSTTKCVPPPCRVDADCAAGQRCQPETGVCVPIGCQRDADCAALERCVQGVCQPIDCRVDDDCDPGETCDVAAGVCRPVVSGCVDDRLEENDLAAEATPLAAGSTLAGVLCTPDLDWFVIPLNVGERLTATLRFDGAEADLDLELRGPDGRSLAIEDGIWDEEILTWDAAESGPHYLIVSSYGEESTGYTLEAQVDASEACADDSLEDNDTFLTATPVLPGVLEGLRLCGGDDDFFAVTVNAGDTIRAQVVYDDEDGDLDLALLDQDGTTVLASSQLTTGEEQLEAVAAAAGTYYLVSYLFLDEGKASYSLTLAIEPGVSSCRDDVLEDNDTLEQARPIAAGEYGGLQICADDLDLFAIAVNAGDTVTTTIRFTHAEGDLDLYLVDEEGWVLDASESEADQETLTVVAEAAGRLLFAVVDYDAAEAAYTLSVQVEPAAVSCRDDGLEENDTLATATPIAAGNHANLAICANDMDFFVFSVNAGDVVQAGISFSNAEGDLDLYLLDSAGTILAYSDGEEDGELLTHTAAAAGSLYLAVLGFDGAENGYALALTLEPAVQPCRDDLYEENDTVQTAARLAAGLYEGLAICPGDQDYFAITLNQGDTLGVLLAFTDDEGDLDLQLIAPDGQSVLASSLSWDDDEDLTVVAEQAGVYTLRIYGFLEASNVYDLLVDVTPAVPSCRDDLFEENDTLATAAALQAGTFDDLMICAGDEDFYRVVLAAGDTLTATIDFAAATGDLDLQLLAADGTLLRSSGGIGDRERVTWTADVAQPVALRIYGWADDEAGYSLTVTVQPAAPPVCEDDDFEDNDTPATARVLRGGLHEGLAVCAGDDDYFAIDLNAGDTLDVTLSFLDANGDLDLTLLAADGTLLASASGVTDEEVLGYVAPAAQTVVLRIYGYQAAQNLYTLDIAITAAVPRCTDDRLEENDTAATATPLAAGELADLAICAGDLDWFSFVLPARGTADLELSFSHVDGDLDLYLVDAAGEWILAFSNGEGDEESISYTSEAGGSFFAVVEGYAGAEAPYSLTLELHQAGGGCVDDAAEQNDSQQAATLLEPGTPFAGMVCAGDDDWFAVDVPAGRAVELRLLSSYADGDLDLQVRAADGTLLAYSQDRDDEELATGRVEDTQTLYVRVYGYDGAEGAYTLTATLLEGWYSCPDDDPLEPNDTTAEAVELISGDRVHGVICPDDVDYFEVLLLGGEALWADLEFSHALGDLDLRLYSSSGQLLDVSETEDDWETVYYEAPRAGFYYLKVYGFDGADNGYTLDLFTF
ncbi:MAG: pre-peptidase C-terminal domain-containing protein, partial [Myxococcota bacterium]|nr:pre-peptidase C-terminal domain-containing protein [Myxococcota bacterium]